MKSRELERPGNDAGARSSWTRRVIIGGLGTAGASVALAALASAAFGNAANPTGASGAETLLSGGAVRVDMSGTWSWGELANTQTSPQNKCDGRSGVGWSVDWWGMSPSQTATLNGVAGSNPSLIDGSLVTPTSSSTQAPQTTHGQLTPSQTWQVQSGVNSGAYFHTTQYFNGFEANLCPQTASNPTGNPDITLDAQGAPSGSWSAWAVYPSLQSIPARICVNFYDPHGKLGNFSTSSNDNTTAGSDNSIQKNDFDPTNVQGQCVVPHLVNPLSISVVKTNNAGGSFAKVGTASSAGQAVKFQAVISNQSSTPTVIDSAADAIAGAAGIPVCDGNLNNGLTQDDNIGQPTLAAKGSPGDSVTCTFTLSNYAPSVGSKNNVITVAGHDATNPNNTTSAHDDSTVNAPTTQPTLAAHIRLCDTGDLIAGGNLSVKNPAGAVIASVGDFPATAEPGNANPYSVTATAPNGYVLVNCPAFNYGGQATQQATLPPSAVLNFYVAPAPGLQVTKTGPATGTAGQNGDYTIKVKNTSSQVAFGAPFTFFDQLPAGESFVSAAQVDSAGHLVNPNKMSCATVAGNSSLVQCTYSGADLAPGASVFVDVTVHWADNLTGVTLTDCAGTTAANAQPGVADPNTQCVPTTFGNPSVTVAKSGPATGLLNGNGTYTIVATNNGSAASPAQTFTDTLPPGEVFAAQFSSPACTGGAVTANGQIITCQLGRLDAHGGFATFSVTVTYTLTGTLTDCATIGGQPVPSCVPTTVVQPNLVVIKSGPATGTLNGSGTYTMVVTNNGNGPSSATTFTDTLPAGESFASATPAGACSSSGQVVTCSVPALAAGGGSTSYTVTVTYTKSGDLTDCATIGGQPVPSCVTTHIPGPPSITVVKTNDANGDGVFHDTEVANNPGDAVTFQVVVTNTSTDPIMIDSVSDAFAAANLAECPSLIGTVLQSGQSVTCTFTVANYAPAAGDSLTNTITVGGHQTTPGGTPVTATDTSTVITKTPPPPGNPDLAIVKIADRASVTVGNTLTYTLTVSNVGDGPTTGPITVTDSVPGGLDLQSVDGGQLWDCAISNGSNITCTYLGTDPVAAGDTLPIITVVTTVNDTAVGSVINTGIVSTPGDVNPTNDRSTVKTPVTKVLGEKTIKNPPAVLPFTGDRTGSMLPVGIAAVLLGGLLLATGRRRRTS